MWPAVAFTRYLADNGEFRAQASILPIAAFGSTLEFAPVGRADMKGPVESSHHVVQVRLDHKIDGTTRGKRPDRGEDAPALNAAMTYFEYMRHLIRRILHHNNVERCEHLLTTEMRRDGVCPTRTSIYQWCVENGYVAGVPPSSDIVRAHLLPAMPAILTGSGEAFSGPIGGADLNMFAARALLAKCCYGMGSCSRRAGDTGKLKCEVTHRISVEYGSYEMAYMN